MTKYVKYFLFLIHIFLIIRLPVNTDVLPKLKFIMFENYLILYLQVFGSSLKIALVIS